MRRRRPRSLHAPSSSSPGSAAGAGGRLTGRVRLQKVVYLLDRLGLNSRFTYDYHHYGPYSRDLDIAVADAKAFVGLEEKFEHRVSDGARYSVFLYTKEVGAAAWGDLDRRRGETLVREFAGVPVTVLELAATIDWLWREEKIVDWRSELIRRKSVKVRNGKMERAVGLLDKLGLTPPAPQPA